MSAAETRVPVSQSRMEIERLLEKHKAKQYATSVDYDALSARVQFRLHDRIIRFMIVLPDPKKFRQTVKYAQADRQRWRALLLVIKAKLEAVENGITTFEDEFMAHVVMPNDRTVAELVQPLIAAAYTYGTMPRALLASAHDTVIDGEVD
jgi:hypothetical protein